MVLKKKMQKKQKTEEAWASGAAYVNLDGFPPVPVEARPRRVYLQILSPLDMEALRGRGYEPMSLLQLPRGTPEHEAFYLLARAQAIEEGTYGVTKEQVQALELQMKAHGMLTSKGVQLRVALTGNVKDAEDILKSWGSSRHTLRGNSTVTAAAVSLKQLKGGEGKRRRQQQDRGIKKKLVERK